MILNKMSKDIKKVKYIKGTFKFVSVKHLNEMGVYSIGKSLYLIHGTQLDRKVTKISDKEKVRLVELFDIN